MIIERTSIFTGKKNVMALNVTPEQMTRFYKGEEKIQDIFTNLDAEQREFILNGITPEEWKEVFGDKPNK